MERWFRKPLGTGAQVYQSLRELRNTRYEHDPHVSPDRLYVVGVDTLAMTTFAYFPPGNRHMATLLGAEPCLAPNFNGSGLALLSDETYPIVPGYSSDIPYRTGDISDDSM